MEVESVSFNHLADRFFSTIYEVNATRSGKSLSFILKISTTSRSCRNEFEQYRYLFDVGVLSLVPVIFSEEYNYLVTEKVELTRFDEYVKRQVSEESRLACFYALGVFFKDMDLKTSGVSRFDKGKFDDYVLPRLYKLTIFSNSERLEFSERIKSVTKELSGSEIQTCFVSDFSLGNINFDNNKEILILDMGDAYIGNRYENIAYMQLTTRFGSLSQYFSVTGIHGKYFSEFLRGYDIENIDSRQLALYKAKHIFDMIDFISSYASGHGGALRHLASRVSNSYINARYKRCARQILGELQ